MFVNLHISVDQFVSSSVAIGECISDHCAVLCKLQIGRPKEPWAEVKYRKIGKINNDKFAKDITSKIGTSGTDCDGDLVKLYFSSLRSVLDQHAPVKRRLLPVRRHSPWYTDDITEAKKERRRREQQWTNTGLVVHRDIFTEQRNVVKGMITESKRTYFKDKINENASNPRALFSIIDKVLHRKEECALPEHSSKKVLAEDFSTYFQSTNSKIRSSLDSQKKVPRQLLM